MMGLDRLLKSYQLRNPSVRNNGIVSLDPGLYLIDCIFSRRSSDVQRNEQYIYNSSNYLLLLL